MGFLIPIAILIFGGKKITISDKFVYVVMKYL